METVRNTVVGPTLELFYSGSQQVRVITNLENYKLLIRYFLWNIKQQNVYLVG
jgi:hypothetical protein